jgi:hypothetical protein
MSSRDARALAVVARLSYTLDFFYKRNLLKSAWTNPVLTLPGQVYGKDFARGAWTYESNLPCYDGLGVEGGIARAKAEMGQALRAAFRAPHSSVGRRLSLAATAALRQ